MSAVADAPLAIDADEPSGYPACATCDGHGRIEVGRGDDPEHCEGCDGHGAALPFAGRPRRWYPGVDAPRGAARAGGRAYLTERWRLGAWLEATLVCRADRQLPGRVDDAPAPSDRCYRVGTWGGWCDGSCEARDG